MSPTNFGFVVSDPLSTCGEFFSLSQRVLVCEFLYFNKVGCLLCVRFFLPFSSAIGRENEPDQDYYSGTGSHLTRLFFLITDSFVDI